MELADRGGASRIIGSRWADFVAGHADGLVGKSAPIPFDGGVYTVNRVVRLDDDHRIARRASRKGLQNPDLLYFGTLGGGPTIQAVDAKFSIETAKSKQVSIEMIQGLITLGSFFDAAVGGIEGGSEILPGLFISPDHAVTRHVLKSGRGITRLSVDPSEIVLLDVSPNQLFESGEEMPLMLELFALDHHDGDPRTNLLASLYYFRLSRAAVSAWIDMRRPLLALNDHVEPEMWSVASNIAGRAKQGGNAWNVIGAWIEEADTVNRQRATIDRAAGLPLHSKDLREWIEKDSVALGIDSISANQVRRRLGSWYRQQLRDTLGPISPPRSDVDRVVSEIAAVSRTLATELRGQVTRFVSEIAEKQSRGDEDGDDEA